MKLLFSGLVLSLSLVIGPSSGFCADIIGTVMDLQGHPVSDVKIVVQNTAGKLFGQAITDPKGHYTIVGLSPNTYGYILNPLTTGLKGGSAVSYLGTDGLTINWKVSDTGDAISLAKQGSKEALANDPFGLSMGEFASIVTLGTAAVAGGVVGGYAAAGGFSSSSTPPPSGGGAPPLSASM